MKRVSYSKNVASPNLKNPLISTFFSKVLYKEAFRNPLDMAVGLSNGKEETSL